jgi:2-polyprenyl-3-methyl-5-hydroxy-6-metoxy-1,4-benzoquinol methylase
MEEVICNLCGGKDARIKLQVYDWYWYNGGPFTIVQCAQCGLTYLNPRPSSSEINGYNQSMWERWSVSDESQEHIGSGQTARITYREMLRDLSALMPQKGSLLEIGIGQGGFLKVFQDDGWNVFGIDISDECVAYTKSKHGIENVIVADLLNANYIDNQFDVVVMNHLIEHLPNPQIYLAEIHRILKPTGILCISTPNIDSLSAAVFRQYWQALLVPLHLTVFSPKTLTKMLNNSNYSVINVSHFSRTTNTYIFLRSVSCIVGLTFRKLWRPSTHDKTLDQPVFASRSKDTRARVVFRVIRPWLSVLVSPIIFFEGLIKKGASITVYASPKK